MSNVKKYDVGQIHFDLFETNPGQGAPYIQYTHSLPLFTLGEADHDLNISLIFNYKRYREEKNNNENPFSIAPGFKLNLQKRMTYSQFEEFTGYQEENGDIVQLNHFVGCYSFDDESQRIVRQKTWIDQSGSSLNDNEIFDGDNIVHDYYVQYPDFRKEKFGSSGRIMAVYDKYSDNAVLSYSYDGNGRLSSVNTRSGKEITLVYDQNTKLLTSITYNGQSILFAYNADGFLSHIQHYLGVKYSFSLERSEHHTGFELCESDYKIEASSVESSETLYSKKLKLCKDGYTVHIIDKNGNDKIVNTVSYICSNHLLYLRPTPYYVDIKDFNGVTTRVQLANKKIVCSYEVQGGEPKFDEEGERFYGNVTLYNTSDASNNHQACGVQTKYDGLFMGHTYENFTHVLTQDLSGSEFPGYYTITGWVKSNNNSVYNIALHIGRTSEDEEVHDIYFDSHGQWQFFSLLCYIENNSVYVRSDVTDSVEFRDVRITGQGSGIELEDDSSHTVMSEYNLLTGNDAIPFRNAQFQYIMNGNSHPIEGVTPADVMRCKLRKAREGVFDEIYSNNGQEIQIGATDLKVLHNGNYISVNNLDLGTWSFSGGQAALTRIHIEDPTEDTPAFIIKMNFIEGTLISEEKLDINQDVVESISEGVHTEYVRDTQGRIINERVDGLYEHQATYTDSLITVKDIDPVSGAVMNSQKYYIDETWGVVTRIETLDANGTVQDLKIFTFDDARNTVVSTAFDGMLIQKHTYAYSKGRLASIVGGSLNYNFAYDDATGTLATVTKNQTPIERHTYVRDTSDYSTVVTDQYPPDDDTSNPLYTRISTYDKYGRLTAIQGILENQYCISPRCGYYVGDFPKYTMEYYNKATHGGLIHFNSNPDGKDAMLSKATDHLANEYTCYGYYAGKLNAALTYERNNNNNNNINYLLRTETFVYDKLGRLKKDQFYHVWSTNESVTSEITYARAEDNPLADNRIEQYKFLVNGSSKAWTINTFDTYKRVDHKEVLIDNKVFSKNINYTGNRISSITDSAGGEISYTYDSLGRIISIDDGNPITYKYDSFGRLNRENNKALDKTFVYRYNSIGNVTQVKEYPYTTGSLPTAVVETAYEYNGIHPDRLTSFGGTSISYNAMGCPTTVNGYTATWTRGKLSKLTKGSRITGTHTYNYTYNAFGQRIGINYNYMAGTSSSSAIVMGMLTSYSLNFCYDQSGRLISESKTSQYYGEGSATEKKVYLYDESGIIGMVYTGTDDETDTYYFRRNLLGDVIGIYNTNGDKVGGYAYDAWGNCTITLNTNGIATKNPIRYRGYYYDQDTGLYYLNARYYNPEWRRFISPDDTSYLDPEIESGLNLYCYCNDDPVNYADPSGHSITAVLIGAFVVGAITGAVISVATQLVDNEYDFSRINPWLVVSDAVFGGLNGLLAASGLGALASAFLGASLGGLQAVISSAIKGETINMTDVLIAAAFGFVGGFIPKTGINAKQVAGKGKTIVWHIKNAVSDRRKMMYLRKGKELILDTATRAGFYVVSTVVSSIGAGYASPKNIGEYSYGT